jgi:hypothetical protein
MILYSKQKNAFYTDELKDVYEKANNWPSDLVELSKEEVETYQQSEPPTGKILSNDANGRPIWVDLPSPTPEQLKQQRIGELKALLAATDFKVLPDYQVRSGKTDAEMQEVYAGRKAWYDELQGLL